MSQYDIITVGGGLGGASLAKSMAERGVRVLVLERETKFKDRVRGEGLNSWGVAEAKELGIYDFLLSTCGHSLSWWDIYVGPVRAQHRDLLATTPQGLPTLTFFHPEMQEALIAAAADAGAEVRRGTRVRDVQPGRVPSVTVEQDGRTEEIRARLVVGADGRSSLVRKWAGFDVHRDPQRLRIAGVLWEEMLGPPEDTTYTVFNFDLGQLTLLFPQGRGRVRAYVAGGKRVNLRLHGEKDVPDFMKASVTGGLPEKFFDGARAAGPLATFEGADVWVEHPYHDGVVLVGDAAAASDPSWGQGLCLTVRDARVLRDALLEHDDWDAAGHAYAAEHDRHYGVIHTVEDWFTQLFMEPGSEADARRARALPLLTQDPSRMPDAFQSGPDAVTVDERARRRLFGEA